MIRTALVVSLLLTAPAFAEDEIEIVGSEATPGPPLEISNDAELLPSITFVPPLIAESPSPIAGLGCVTDREFKKKVEGAKPVAVEALLIKGPNGVQIPRYDAAGKEFDRYYLFVVCTTSDTELWLLRRADTKAIAKQFTVGSVTGRKANPLEATEWEYDQTEKKLYVLEPGPKALLRLVEPEITGGKWWVRYGEPQPKRPVP